MDVSTNYLSFGTFGQNGGTKTVSFYVKNVGTPDSTLYWDNNFLFYDGDCKLSIAPESGIVEGNGQQKVDATLKVYSGNDFNEYHISIGLINEYDSSDWEKISGSYSVPRERSMVNRFFPFLHHLFSLLFI